jgi:hypothetical protein
MSLKIFTRLGRLIKVKNTKTRSFSNENEHYIAVWVKEKGEAKCLMFTESEIVKAEFRAYKNIEDQTQRSWISKIID